MSMVIVRDALIDKLENVGLVEGRQGRTTGLPWTDGSILPLWTVTCIHSGLAPGVVQPMGGNKCFERVFRLRGFFPHLFDADSDTTWLQYLDTVMDLLSPQPALDICTQTTPPVLMENDFIMYGEVLCHFAVFNFATQEWMVY